MRLKSSPTEKGEFVFGSSPTLSVELFKQGKTISEIAEQRILKPTTIESHLISAFQTGNLDIKVDRILSKKEFKEISDKWKLIGGDKLKPIKEALPDYTYSQIRWAYQFLTKIREADAM